jgi:signal transduction histidine kinase
MHMAKVKVDLPRVVEALVNLFSNAIKEMKEAPGPRAVTVRTMLSPDGAYALVVIRNPYPNVTDAQIAKFFELGYTSQRGRNGHLGLGLPLTKKLIEGQNGKLVMKPHPAGGVETTVWLPVAKSAPQQLSKGDSA